MIEEIMKRDDIIYEMAEDVHNAYLETCKRLGWSIKPENNVPFDNLSDDAKEINIAAVKAVLSSLKEYEYWHNYWGGKVIK